MNYYIKMQGTCWLIQYLNYIKEPYDSKRFYELLAINRYLRYTKAIYLINNKQILNDKKYLISTLMSFEGNLFDVEDIFNYAIKGNINDSLNEETIYWANEQIYMLILEMWDNSHIDNFNKIFKIFYSIFGNIKIVKVSSNLEFSVLSQDVRFKSGIYNIRNANMLYSKSKCIVNSQTIVDTINDELSRKNKILACIDIGKSILYNNFMLLPNNISLETLNSFFNIDNHYYVIIGKKNIDGNMYYEAFSGYDDRNKYIFISEKYLKVFIDHILYDKIVVDNDITDEIDIVKLMECG